MQEYKGKPGPSHTRQRRTRSWNPGQKVLNRTKKGTLDKIGPIHHEGLTTLNNVTSKFIK